VNSAPPREGFLSGYSDLLKRSEVRRLVSGSMIARLPSAMLPLGILLLVNTRLGSLAAAGLIVGAFSVGRAAASPLVGALIDRLGQLWVLVSGAAVQAILLGGLLVAVDARASVPVTAIVAAAAGAATPPIQACLRALWPVVAPGDAARDAAYSFDATSQELIWIFGPLLVSLLLLVATPGVVIVVCAAIGFAGVTLFVVSPVSRGWRGSRDSKRSRLGALGSRDLRALLVTVVFAGVSWGALTFGVAALAVNLGSSRASGLLLALVSIGSITGGVLIGARRWSWSTIKRYRALLAATVLCCAPLLLANSIAIAAPMSLIAGFPLAATYASQYILTGRSAQKGTTTEAFTWLSSMFALGISVGYAGAGAASQAVDIHAAFAVACLASAAAALLVLLMRDR
jgi:predicted MFS family arabinose efflux permease